jgi:hypothetical protein
VEVPHSFTSVPPSPRQSTLMGGLAESLHLIGQGPIDTGLCVEDV